MRLLLQVGTFTTHSGQFFLEPLLSADGEYEDQRNKPHLIYKHDAQGTPSDTRPCTTSGESVRCLNDAMERKHTGMERNSLSAGWSVLGALVWVLL